MRRVLATVTLVGSMAVSAVAQAPSSEHWIATWTTAVVARPAALPALAAAPAAPINGVPPPPGPPAPPPITPNNQTLREIVRTSMAGTRARVVFANTYGTAPVAIGGASIALRERDSTIVPASMRKVTVNGSATFLVPPGAVVLSDPVTLTIPALADVAIDAFIPGDLGTGTSPITFHNGANQTSYAATGNHVGETSLQSAAMTRSWFLLSRLEVVTPRRAGAIAAFGDSITDGARSTPDTNNRWPDHLARRLAAQGGGQFAVMNVGIAGNRVLSEGNGLFGGNAGINALARFDRDVLAQPGITHVIVMEGINDVRNPGANGAYATADELIAAYRQMIDRAHEHGLRIYGATLTPCGGDALMTPEGEARRTAINQWIRTGRMFDGVVDFDAVVRDPAAPTKIRAEFDSGDHLHPNDAGYKAMGESIDLALFKPSGS